MAEYCLLREDFFDHPGARGLSCDYLTLRAACTVHPQVSSAGVVYWSRASARTVGIDFDAAIAGLRVLTAKDLLIFDESTMETWSTDHFLINQSSADCKNGLFLKQRKRDLQICKSALIAKVFKESDEAAAGAERMASQILPVNLISRFAGANGKLMLSDAAIALAAHCNVSTAGVGQLDYQLFADLTNQTADAARGGFANIAARGVAEIDEEAGEYRIRRYLDMPGKLRHAQQAVSIFDALEDVRSEKFRKDCTKQMCSILGLTQRELNAQIAAARRASAAKCREKVFFCTENVADGAENTPGSLIKSKGSSTPSVNNTSTKTNTSTSTKQSAGAGAPACPSGDVERGGWVFEKEEKQKAGRQLAAAGWSADSFSGLLALIEREANSKKAGLLVVACLLAARPGDIRSPAALARSMIKQANEGVLPAPTRVSTQFNISNEERTDKFCDDARFNGMRLGDIMAIKAAERGA